MGFVLEFLFSLLWWFLLFPVVWLVSLPFIWVIALFRRARYGIAVTDMLASVHCSKVERTFLVPEAPATLSEERALGMARELIALSGLSVQDWKPQSMPDAEAPDS